MKILLVHNYYQKPGGEDRVFANESRMLRENGNTVVEEVCHNNKLNTVFTKISAGLNTVYSFASKKKFKARLAEVQPDVVHVHNFFPLFSPSIFSAAKEMRIPIVLTLHNFRILCPTATLMHDGKICERSLEQGPFWAVRRRVYRDSWLATLALAMMIWWHQKRGTWWRQVDRIIVLNNFSESVLRRAGMTKAKLLKKPNFAFDPHNAERTVTKQGGYALFLGRLSSEKGPLTLCQAWQGIDLNLKIVGDGPLKPQVKEAAADNDFIDVLGYLEPAEVQALVQHAEFLVVPSECYENFPLSVVEAYANGTPVVASDIGGLSELVEDYVTGLKARPFDVISLAEKIKEMRGLVQQPKYRMPEHARKFYLANFTPSQNYQQLISIYQQAIDEAV